jgi:ribonuclease VapC
MVIDSSALVALLLGEPEADEFTRAIALAPARRVSAASYLETGIVMSTRAGSTAREILRRLVDELSLEIVPVSQDQAELALAAYQRFGRGSGHPARLNFGDCFTYALAAQTGEPVLFKGDDFSRTDLALAINPPSP